MRLRKMTRSFQSFEYPSVRTTGASVSAGGGRTDGWKAAFVHLKRAGAKTRAHKAQMMFYFLGRRTLTNWTGKESDSAQGRGFQQLDGLVAEEVALWYNPLWAILSRETKAWQAPHIMDPTERKPHLGGLSADDLSAPLQFWFCNF